MSQSQSPSPSPSPSPPRQNGREYSGIFSSSLCGMFESGPQSKADACALACCGVWLWERNQYLLEQKTPKPWRQRPIETGIILLIISTAIVWTIDPENLFLQVAAILIVSGILWKMLEFQHTRAFFRLKLAIDRYARDHPEQQQELNLQDPGLHLYLAQNRREIHGVHALCGCSRIDHVTLEEDDETKDFCRRLWRFLAALCCGTCCMCWCQWCGICATAQEHRHLRKILPPNRHLFQRDYITMQPWKEYFPDILQLRANKVMRFLPHVRALSLFSSRLLKAFGLFLLASILVSALPVHYSRWELLVLFGTFLQPIVVLYFVYWFWNRLDISFDALIKFFASGFFVCTSIVIVYEIIVSMVASCAVLLSGLLGSFILVLTGQMTVDMQEADDDGAHQEGIKIDVPTPYKIALALFGAFLNAFLVAALVEELGKYLCFWMVEHPDLDHDEPNSASTCTTTREDMELLPPDDETTETEEAKPRVPVSLVSRGSAITIAMVTTALGFACAENLLYVFVYTPPGIAVEVSTLIVRCMFPVHPLAAALQSIGVCRRDLERDRSTQVGRILFPAWLLHGIFDFVLMAYALVAEMLEDQSEETEQDKNSAAEEDNGDESAGAIEEFKSSGFMYAVVFSIPLFGLVYFFKEAWAQRKRLEELDSRNEIVGRSEVLGIMS